MNENKPGLVLKNGAVYTVDNERSWAQAIAVAGDRIIFVGSDAEVGAYLEPETEVIDLNGKMVLPGFVDAHAHPSHAMDLVGNISLYLQDSVEKYIQTIRGFIDNHPDAQAFRGSGWSDSLFPSTGPSKEILDELVPDRPIVLVSYDGHSRWVNSVTLERAAISRDTPNPQGGVIERVPETGEPNGTLRDTASKLINKVIPDYSLEERVNALLAYQEMAHKAGITMCHDAMLEMPSISSYIALQEAGELHMRFRGAIEIKPDLPFDEQLAFLLAERVRNSHPNFQTNTAKIFVDGVVEGGTAYLLEPYQHMPESRGELIWSPEALKVACAALDKQKVQIHMHVIGDAATRIALDALQFAQKRNGRRDARHLLTHMQLVSPEDIPRFKRLGLIGVANPYWFKVDDYYWTLALPYLGRERADHQYPMQSLFEVGVRMASASDFPVTIPFDPLIGIELGLTRSEIGGKSEEVLWPQERSSLENMIASFTFNGAYANFLENEYGSLEVGKKADMIILDRNLFQIPTIEIAHTKVLHTFVDGKEVFHGSG